MNEKKVRELRDFLATIPPERFNMKHVFSDASGEALEPHEFSAGCGTAACILGWAEVLFKTNHDQQDVENILDISFEEGRELFMPFGFSWAPEAFPLSRALAILDHLLATGEVDWSVSE